MQMTSLVAHQYSGVVHRATLRTLAADVNPTLTHTSARNWCSVVRRNGLGRPWDVLVPPKRLYDARSSFQIGTHPRFTIVYNGHTVIGAYVMALRGDAACLIDIRSNGPTTWFDHALDDIEPWAYSVGAAFVKGPVGAYAFLTDGVITESVEPMDSIHLATPPSDIVASFERRGYVPCVSGHINGRVGGKAVLPLMQRTTGEGVTIATWLTIVGIIRRMIKVLDASFSTLSWHSGPGASTIDLMRTYLPVALPKGVMMIEQHGAPVGGVIAYRDVRHVPTTVLRWPVWAQRLWLMYAARRSKDVHVSVAGVLPAVRRTKLGLAAFERFTVLLAQVGDVSTSWIDDRNDQSGKLTIHAGLLPCQHRRVYCSDRLRGSFTKQEGQHDHATT